MKTILISLLTIFSIQIVKADIPKIYLEITNTNTEFIIESHVFWNVDNTTQIPENFFSGNNKSIDTKFMVGNNEIIITTFFPEQKNGRNLNASTTVLISIYINEEKIVSSEHFGQISDDFLAYNTDILCRLNFIKISFTDDGNAHLLANGEYEYKDKPQKFKYKNTLAVNKKTLINDSVITSYVLENGPIPYPLNDVEEKLIIGNSGTRAIYSFETKINNPSEEFEYDWKNFTTIYTKKATSFDLANSFNTIQQEYLSYKNMVGFRIYDPVIHFFSNDIVFDEKKVKNVYDNRYTFTNLTDHMNIKSGIEILNPINCKTLTIQFSKSWEINSIIVRSELTKYKIENNVVTFYNDGDKKLDYTVFASKTAVYSILRKNKQDDIIYYAKPYFKKGKYIKRGELKKTDNFYGVFLKKGSYSSLLRCEKENMKVNIYWNNIPIKKRYEVSATYDNNIINIPIDVNTKTITIENINNEAIKLSFDLMTYPGEDIVKYLNFTLKKGEAIEIPFIF